ncbi:hypothetical protein CerSpe_064760 [Prunus speciosa]
MLLPHLRAYIVCKTLVSLLNFLRLIHRKARLSSSSSKCPSPPPFDPTHPFLPISYPIKILEELESFHYPFNKASVALQSVSSTSLLPNRLRVNVCHCRNMVAGWLWR